jgi:hypothetical protein
MTPRGGSAPQAEGAVFEELLEWIHKGYLTRGRAAIYHNKIAGNFIGYGRFVPDPNLARPDFSGTLREGRAVHFDAKTMQDAVGWRLPKESQHQYDRLLEQAKMGAVAFFLIECRSAETVYLLRVHPEVPVGEDGRPGILFADVPVADWRLAKHVDHRCKHKAVTAPTFCIPRNADGLYDWLDPVETFWLGLLPVEAKPAGRPRRNAMRDAAIFKLAKTHSRKEVRQQFHISQARISQIIRGAKVKHES